LNIADFNPFDIQISFERIARLYSRREPELFTRRSRFPDEFRSTSVPLSARRTENNVNGSALS
jgi:hypothetical protein